MAQKPKPVASADVDDSNDDNVRSSAKLPFYQAWIDGISSALSNVSVSQSSLGILDIKLLLFIDFHIADDNKSTALLKECTLEGVAQYMLEKKPKNVLLMTGAGISTSAGIPDFRTPGSGLYDNLAKYNLPDPHAIFDIAFFMQNPEPFFALARELFPKVLKVSEMIEYRIVNVHLANTVSLLYATVRGKRVSTSSIHSGQSILIYMLMLIVFRISTVWNILLAYPKVE